MNCYMTERDPFGLGLRPDLTEVIVTADELRFSADDVNSLVELVPSMRLAVWRLSNGEVDSPKVRNFRGAFGDWPSLRKHRLDRYVLTSPCGESMYLESALVDSNTSDDTGRLIGESMFGRDSGVFFCPDAHAAREALRLIGSLMMARLANQETWLQHRQHTVREFVERCCAIGVPGLATVDPDDAHGLVFWASEAPKLFVGCHGYWAQSEMPSSLQTGDLELVVFG